MDKANDYLREEFEWFIASECFINALRWEAKRGSFSYVKFEVQARDN